MKQYINLIKETEEALARAKTADKITAEKLLVRVAVHILYSIYKNKSNESKQDLLDELGDLIDVKDDMYLF